MGKRIWKTRNVLLILILTMYFGICGARADVNDLIASLNALEDHITGVAPLSGSEIAAHKATIDSNSQYIGDNATVITASMDVVIAYDTEVGPLFVSGSPVQSFGRSSTSDEDIAWAVYNVMQYIMDYTYTVANIVSHEVLLDGFKFGSSAHFPGAVDPPVDPQVSYTVPIDGTYLDMWGHEIMHEDRPAVKCTGTYAAPGSIVTVTVPSALVGNGYTVRVCAHSWDFSNKPTIKRLDRSSLVYDIDSTQVKVASPLGGGIYIQVPEGQDAGVVDVQIKNVVLAPYFSAKSFHTTTLSEWQNIERHHPAPWADFQSEKYIMQVPTDWIYNFDDPVTLMQDWDTAMDIVDDLMGFPVRTRESMYQQVDLFFRASVYAPGYPTVNVTYNPNTSYGGDRNHWMLNGPQYAHNTVFHEEGHGYQFVKFPGEMESTVNLLHVPVYDHFHGDLDYAFRTSRGFGNTYMTLDTTAITWMVVFNFSPREVPMADGEKAYQLKGHAKFVDIARLFGWETLENFWYSINVDYEDGIIWSKHGSDIDDLIFRWCESVGVDLRPLFHFWGTHPVNAANLANRIASAGLPRSPEILATLGHYKSIVPADNAAFQDHALDWWGHVPSIGGNWTEREHTRQWDTTNYWEPYEWEYCGTDPAQADGEIYTEATHDRIVAVIDGLIALYFPGSDIEPPTPNPMTWATAPYATGDSSITMVATTASDPCGVEYYFRCTAGGGNDSGWQAGTSYTDTGLSPDTQYTYTVQARDLSPAANTTAPSTAESATTG
ncbi:MAG: M60 family metallopeptidase, partial [Planctomycetota bacterium]